MHKHRRNYCRILITGFLILFWGLIAENKMEVQAQESTLSREEYQTRMEDAIELAEVFRTDENFIYDTGFTEEEETALRSVNQKLFGVGEVTQKSKVLLLSQYVNMHMQLGEQQDNNTYQMLCEETTDGELPVGNSMNYVQAARDLCVLEGIPVFMLYDNRDMDNIYALLMVYIDGEWKFIDVANDPVTMYSADEAYTAFYQRTQPLMIGFEYPSNEYGEYYAYGIYINQEALKESKDSVVMYGCILCYDAEKQAVLMMYDDSHVMANGHFYGTNQCSDAEGRVPTGLVEYAVGFSESEDNSYWEIYHAYSQYGILLRGRVTIDGVEYNFDQRGNITGLPIYQVTEQRQKEGDVLTEKSNAERIARLQRVEQIAEALNQDKTYIYDLDLKEEEIAYLQEAVDTATSYEWIVQQEALLEYLGVEVPTEGGTITDKAKAIGLTTYIAKHVSYPDYFTSFKNSYEILVSGEGICGECSVLLRDMCVLADIPCFSLCAQLITSGTNKPYTSVRDHASNVLLLDGEWYFADTTNKNSFLYTGDTPFGRDPFEFQFSHTHSTDTVYISYDMMLFDRSNPASGLCYEFDEDGNLGIYYMSRTGPIANYESRTFSTDENGKLLVNNGFVTWEDTEDTDEGKETYRYTAYSRQGYTVPGTNVIDGKEYQFTKERETSSPYYIRELIETKYRIGRLEIEAVENQTYTGSAICPVPVIKHGDKILEPGVDYTITYEDNVEVTPDYSDGAVMVIEGKGDYYNTARRYFRIEKKDISDMEVSIDWTESTWDIEMDATGFTSYDYPNVSIDIPKDDYTIEYYGFSQPGEASVVIKGRYNCTGRIEKTCILNPISFDTGAFVIAPLSETGYEYRGNEWEPAVTVQWNYEDGSLYRELDSSEYRVTYENNIEVGTAKVTVEGEGRFAGTLEGSFEIVPWDITKDEQLQTLFCQERKVQYTGEPVMPEIPGITYTTQYTYNRYVKDTDFTLSAENNVELGTATVTLQGIGKYTGTMTQTFQIVPKAYKQADIILSYETIAYNGKVQYPEVSIGNLVSGKDFKIICQKWRSEEDRFEEIEPIEPGIYYVCVEMLNPNYYIEGTSDASRKSFKILEKGEEDAGSLKETTPSEPKKYLNAEGRMHKAEVQWVTINKAIKAIPAVEKIKKFKVTAKKKALVLSWEKATEANGYQIQVSTKKNFKGAKTISVKKSKTKYTAKKLKSKKTYYARIRAYQTYKDIDGKTQKVYGKWVTIKKKTK